VTNFLSCAVNEGMTEHRMNYKRLLLKICQSISQYEPVYHLYKKSYDVYKKSIASAAEKLMEHLEMFIEAKEALFTTFKNYTN
jgi:predicted small secreted protein